MTDRGKWLRARIALAGAGNPVLQAVEMAPMLDTAGAPLRSKYNSDAEAIAAIPARAGRFAVSFERADRIWTYDIGEHGLSAPAGDPGAAIGAFPTNHGVEAIVALPRSSPLGAAIIAFAEGASGGVIPGFILGGTRPGRFSIVPHEEFDVTDAALGPDGAIYLLHRYFTVLRGPMMAISRLRPDDIAPGARLTTELLMHANVTHEIDNMEALAAHEGADGNTVLTLMSDNNFNALQRTLLLRFSVME